MGALDSEGWEYPLIRCFYQQGLVKMLPRSRGKLTQWQIRSVLITLFSFHKYHPFVPYHTKWTEVFHWHFTKPLGETWFTRLENIVWCYRKYSIILMMYLSKTCLSSHWTIQIFSYVRSALHFVPDIVSRSPSSLKHSIGHKWTVQTMTRCPNLFFFYIKAAFW